MPLTHCTSTVMDNIGFDENAVATFYRAEKVDDSKVLGSRVKGLIQLKIPIALPLCPQKQINFDGIIRGDKVNKNRSSCYTLLATWISCVDERL